MPKKAARKKVERKKAVLPQELLEQFEQLLKAAFGGRLYPIAAKETTSGKPVLAVGSWDMPGVDLKFKLVARLYTEPDWPEDLEPVDTKHPFAPGRS